MTLSVSPKNDNTEVVNKIVSIFPGSGHSSDSNEVLSFMLLYTVSLVSPITKVELIKHLVSLLKPLVSEKENITKRIEKLIDKHLMHKNITLTKRPNSNQKRRQIYASPPAFIELNDKYFLIGIGGQDQSLGNTELQQRLRYTEHLRWWNPNDFNGKQRLDSLLDDSRIMPLQKSDWIGMDEKIEKKYRDGPETFLKDVDAQLEAFQNQIVEAPKIQVLDHATKPDYYKGRWVDLLQKHSGNYIIRYGEKWDRRYSYARIQAKTIIKRIQMNQIWDQNLKNHRDLALMIQSAIDASNDRYQKYGFQQQENDDKCILNLFHLIPSWLERKILALGLSIPKEEGKGILMSYEIPNEVKEEILETLEASWLKSKN
jgi:hypothetical protein